MYYKKNKVIFPHIPKTGGSSLEYFIGQVEHPEMFNPKERKMTFLNKLYKMYQLEPEDKRWDIHRPARVYMNEFGEEKYDSFYSFSFVRNPFSQIKSLYTMNKEYAAKRGNDYPAWEDYIFSDTGQSIKTYRKFLDQRWFLSDRSGNLIVNEVFPFEYYEDCVNRLSSKIGFEPDFEVRMWATKPEYEYTPDMIERVMNLYGSSYELWKKIKTHWEKTSTPYAARKKSSTSNTGKA